MQLNIDFSNYTLTAETFTDLGNTIRELEVGILRFLEPIRKVVIKSMNGYLDADDVHGYLFSSQLTDLETVDIMDTSKNLCSDDGLVYSKDFKDCIFCPLGKKGTIKIHEGTERVCEYACYACTFSHLIIPDSVKVIEQYAFHRNKWLECVEGGYGLKSIGDMSFMDCIHLKDFHLGSNLKRIGESAFMNTQLTKIDLPEELEYVGSHAFHTTNIQKDEETSHITPDKMYDIHIPSSLKEIGRCAFCNAANIYTKQVSFEIVEAGIRSAGQSFSYGCDFWKLHIKGLQPIVMPKEVNSITMVARKVRLYAIGKSISPPEMYTESRRVVQFVIALEHRKLYPGKQVDKFLNENIKRIFVSTLLEEDGEKLMVAYIKSDVFTKEALASLLDYIESSEDSAKYVSLRAYLLQAMAIKPSPDIFEI